MYDDGDPRSSLTVIVGIIGAILLLAVVVLAQVLFYNVQRVEEQTKVLASRPQELLDLQAKQLGQIHATRYIDQEHGVVAIPIDRAMELFAADPNVPASMPATQPAVGGQKQ
jgi:hypothetical protein